MASGSGGQIALMKAGSLYSAMNSVDQWFAFSSESLEHTLEELEEENITGRRDAPPSHKGLDYGAGDINFEPNPNALGHIFNGAIGTVASSLITHAGSTGANSVQSAGKPVFHHIFNPRATAFEERSFLEPYHVMVYKDVGSAWVHDGIFTGISLNLQAGQLLKATVNMMSRKVRRIARSAAISSLVSRGGRPFVWDMASVQVASGGTGSAFLAYNPNFESIEFGFTTPHEGVALLDGTKNYAEFQPSDFRRCEISGTLSFKNQEEYDAFVAYESRYLRINLTNTSSAMLLGNPSSVQYYTLQIDVPSFKFLSYSNPIGGPNRLTAQFRGKAEYDEDAGFMFQARLTNVTSLY